MRDTIQIQTRGLQGPAFGATDFDENFSDVPLTWASIETINGATRFDGVSRDLNVTHRIRIRFDATVTSESWLLLEDGQRLDVVDVNPLDERKDFMELICVTRGLNTKDASKV
jgi:SPP1 family predicted phage head-tail adaptor